MTDQYVSRRLSYLEGLIGAKKPSTAGPPGTTGHVIFRAGVPSAGQAVETFAEVPRAIANGATTLFVDSSIAPCNTDGTGLTALNGNVQIRSWNQGQNAAQIDLLTVTDGDTLQNMGGLDGTMSLLCLCTTTPALSFTGPAPAVTVRQGNLVLDAGATVPAFTVLNGQFFSIIGEFIASIFGGGGGIPLLSCDNGGILAAYGFELSNFDATTFGSVAGAFVAFQGDASVAAPAHALCAPGTFVSFPADFAVNTKYTATTPANWAGAAPVTVGAALDRLAAAFVGLAPPVHP
jgi:hypothetical protein